MEEGVYILMSSFPVTCLSSVSFTKRVSLKQPLKSPSPFLYFFSPPSLPPQAEDKKRRALIPGKEGREWWRRACISLDVILSLSPACLLSRFQGACLSCSFSNLPLLPLLLPSFPPFLG